jgi:hypothetical protein
MLTMRHSIGCNTVVKVKAGISTGILVLLRRRSMPLNPATLRFPNVMPRAGMFNARAGACARYRILVGGVGWRDRKRGAPVSQHTSFPVPSA